MRIAAIDIGTNTVQLLVAEATDQGLRRLHTSERFVRLGEGVDREGRIGSAAQQRLMDAVKAHLDTAQSIGAEDVIVGGTSALRDAANRTDVTDSIRERLGFSVDILSGSEEATWSFAAACSAFDDLEGPVLVVDIGGGSTELIAGANPSRYHPAYERAIRDRASLDLGCVRLTERYFSQQPPSRTAVKKVERAIDVRLNEADVDPPANTTLVGTAGTASALVLVDEGPHSTWDASHGAGSSLSHAVVRRWRSRLLDLPVDDILQLHPAAMDGRADVFPVGVILLDRIMNHFEVTSCRVSPYELRHGLALRRVASHSTEPSS